MDNNEKRVLRWKRHLLANKVILNKDSISDLEDRGLIWDEIIESIQNEHSNYAKMARYLDLLLRSHFDPSAFQSFCRFLDIRHPWISEELRIELLAEQGHVAVEEYIKKESALLIYRFFGRTKRISDRDKKKMETLIALRTQCAKDAWRKNLEKTQQTLDELFTMNKEKDEKLKEIAKRLKQLVEMHRRRSPVRTRSARSSTLSRSDDRKSSSGRSLLQKIDVAVDDVEQLVASCTAELQGIKDEKRRTLEMIAVDDATAKLDREVELAIHRLAAQLKNYRAQAKDEEQRTKTLEDQLRTNHKQHDDELKDRDHTIKVLATNLEKSQNSVFALENQIGSMKSMKQQLQVTQSELVHTKSRSRYLEKSRHLGYDCERYLADGANFRNGELPKIETSERKPAVSNSLSEKKKSKALIRPAASVRL